MRKLLDEKLKRFEELENRLVDPEVLGNPSKMANVAREHGSLNRLATKYRRFKQLNAEIAEALFVSENTVKTHIKNILSELHSKNRSEAVAYASRMGILGDSAP